MSELHPELAKATARTALQFLAAFNGEDWGILRQDNPGPNDRRHLAIALDYIQELGAMVLNLADRVGSASLPAAEDARDAARYRWLKERTVSVGLSRWMGAHQFLDHAIDLAMSGSEKCD